MSNFPVVTLCLTHYTSVTDFRLRLAEPQNPDETMLPWVGSAADELTAAVTFALTSSSSCYQRHVRWCLPQIHLSTPALIKLVVRRCRQFTNLLYIKIHLRQTRCNHFSLLFSDNFFCVASTLSLYFSFTCQLHHPSPPGSLTGCLPDADGRDEDNFQFAEINVKSHWVCLESLAPFMMFILSDGGVIEVNESKQTRLLAVRVPRHLYLYYHRRKKCCKQQHWGSNSSLWNSLINILQDAQ